MITIDTTTATVEPPRDDFVIHDAQLAAVAFLARYSGRTLDACRHDLRGFFQWAPTRSSLCWRPRGRTSSCSEAGWRSGAWRPRRSTGDRRRCAAAIASRTSTGASLRTRRSTSADPRTTTIYDHRRQNLDRHAAHVVVAFVAGG
jgi:hypothetical protein